MSAASYWESFLWSHFSKPRCFAGLFQRLKRLKPTRIVELGIFDVDCSQRLVRLAERYTQEKIQYCGIDLFEARSTNPLPLKKVHRQLSETTAQVRLIPGDLFSGVGRTANLLTGTDLLVIHASHKQSDLQRVYPFFPRMVHPGTAIARFSSETDTTRLRWLKPNKFVASSNRAA